ncbi:IS630 family transposase [Candidatus Riflebacteria bacterium]
MWCIPELNEEYIQKMEDVLRMYQKAFNPNEPMIVIDEKPVQLLKETRKKKEANRPGKILKQDYEYKRCGTANIFVCGEPKAGKYFARITKCKKFNEFAKTIITIEKKYKSAKKIHLIMDNLNTHREKSVIKYLGEKEGKKLWKRFNVHYTPKHGSWLNQAEIIIGILVRQCLNGNRIPERKLLRKKVNTCLKRLSEKKMKIDWKFTVRKARKKFRYKNSKYIGYQH